MQFHPMTHSYLVTVKRSIPKGHIMYEKYLTSLAPIEERISSTLFTKDDDDDDTQPFPTLSGVP